MQTRQINQEVREFFNSDFFKEIENKVVGEAISEASKTARRELDLFKFEIIYQMIVSKKELVEVEEFINELRNKKWREALKKSKGDEEKALMLV